MNADGLSQTDRIKQISSLKYPQLLDNEFDALLKRSLEIASYLKFFHQSLSGELIGEGYFDEVFRKSFNRGQLGEHSDGNLEPSLAVLGSFLENLQQTTDFFNERWKDLPRWYHNELLGVLPKPLKGDNVWTSFQSIGDSSITLPKGTGFKVDYPDNITNYYNLRDEVEVHDISIEKLYLLHLQKHLKESNSLSSLRAINLVDLVLRDANIQEANLLESGTGIRIISPVLLLSEGVRKVMIHCFPTSQESYGNLGKTSLNALFKINISTTDGWESIAEYNIIKNNDELLIEFILPDSFPSTSGCTFEKHNFISENPVVNLYLNMDSSDFQKSKVDSFLISKVKLAVSAKGITNIKVYNELGKVDNSKPFAPFGINTEKGTWFTIGNYEISKKDTKKIYTNFYWEQLPDHPRGMADHYVEYGGNISNRSFKLEVRYLSDFQWKEVRGKNQFHLFDTESDTHQLSDVTVIGPVDIEKMPIVLQDEEEYDYSLKSRNGFVNFRLISPEIGFGEQLYRQVFTEQMMKNARKKKKFPSIKPPVQPILKRITLDYEAEDIIDMRTTRDSDIGRVQHILPLEEFALKAPRQNDFIHFVPRIEDYNLLMALNGVKENIRLSLFIDVMSQESNGLYRSSIREKREDLREIRVYLGNPVYWKRMPLSFIVKDETMALLMSGKIEFQFPDTIGRELYDDRGSLWLRIAFDKADADDFPEIKSIHVNAGLLEMRLPEVTDDQALINQQEGEIVEENLVPGLGNIVRISPFYGGWLQETSERMFLRIAEYTSHKGRAVTSRDYERLVLENFPEIAKVKCLISKQKTSGWASVHLIVFPHPHESLEEQQLLTPPHLLYFIEKFIRGLTSAYVQEIKVVNPVYEQLIIRYNFKFKGYFSLKRKKLLEQIINNCIAPWGFSSQLPEIGFEVDLKKMYQRIVHEFEGDMSFTDFSAIYINQTKQEFRIHEFFYLKDGIHCDDYIVKPLEPNSILVPAKEHIMLSAVDHSVQFGINDMSIGNSFIIPKN